MISVISGGQVTSTHVSVFLHVSAGVYPRAHVSGSAFLHMHVYDEILEVPINERDDVLLLQIDKICGHTHFLRIHASLIAYSL